MADPGEDDAKECAPAAPEPDGKHADDVERPSLEQTSWEETGIERGGGETTGGARWRSPSLRAAAEGTDRNGDHKGAEDEHLLRSDGNDQYETVDADYGDTKRAEPDEPSSEDWANIRGANAVVHEAADDAYAAGAEHPATESAYFGDGATDWQHGESGAAWRDAEYEAQDTAYHWHAHEGDGAAQSTVSDAAFAHPASTTPVASTTESHTPQAGSMFAGMLTHRREDVVSPRVHTETAHTPPADVEPAGALVERETATPRRDHHNRQYYSGNSAAAAFAAADANLLRRPGEEADLAHESAAERILDNLHTLNDLSKKVQAVRLENAQLEREEEMLQIYLRNLLIKKAR